MIGGYADSRGMCVLAKRHVSTLNHYKTHNLSHFWSILKWIELDMNGMDLGSKGQTPHVGARLKALDEAVLMAASDFSCNFFHFPRPRIWTMCLSILKIETNIKASHIAQIGKLGYKKNCRRNLRLPWERPHQELSNEPPHEGSCP